METMELPKLDLPATIEDSVNIPESFRGKWTVLYFYPKDSTPGCTVQACEYRDNLEKFSEKDIAVYGVSLDDLHSHYNFESNHSISFPLLCDEKRVLSKALGVLKEARKDGKKSYSLSRDTFLLNPHVQVVKVWRGVDPKTTVQETFDAACAFISEA